MVKIWLKNVNVMKRWQLHCLRGRPIYGKISGTLLICIAAIFPIMKGAITVGLYMPLKYNCQYAHSYVESTIIFGFCWPWYTNKHCPPWKLTAFLIWKHGFLNKEMRLLIKIPMHGGWRATTNVFSLYVFPSNVEVQTANVRVPK